MSEHKRKQLARQAQAEAGVLDDGTYRLTPSWSLLRRSIQLWQQNLATSLFFFLLPALLTLLGQYLIGNLSKPDFTNIRTYIGMSAILLGVLWQYLNVVAGVFYMTLRATLGEHPGIWQSYRRGLAFLPRLTGLCLMLALVILVGLICFIVPGVKAARKYVLSPFYVVDRHVGIREAMDMSAADSKPAAGAIWGTIAVASTLGIASLAISRAYPPYSSLASLVLGTLFNFGFALRYRDITNAKQQAILLTRRHGKK